MYVDILILANLAARPQHGYEIKKSVEQVVGGEINLNNGALYPALRRFEQMGAVERETARQQGKPDRHIYSLTALGAAMLHDLLCEFPPDVARHTSEFFVRVSFFHLLEASECVAILDARRAFLLGALAQHERIRAKVAAERLPFPPHAQQVLRFQEGQTRAELAWVDSLAQQFAQEGSPAATATTDNPR